MEAVRLHGKDWSKITEHVGTRTRALIASHAQQFRKKVEKNPNLEGADIVTILTDGSAPRKREKKKPALETEEKMETEVDDDDLLT